MLPKDTQRHYDTAAAAATGEQTCLDSHLKELPPKERVIPYTDDLFCHAAMEWLVSMDQVSGLYHNSSVAYMNFTTANSGVSAPSLSKNDWHRCPCDQWRQDSQWLPNLTSYSWYIQGAANSLTCATNGALCVTCWSITPHHFLTYYLQSNAVKGKVSLTCDAWQASNVDGYFAVTGSWIEEEPGNGPNRQWELQMVLLGFTQLNSAHNSVWLGQALFKIVSRAGIGHKVRHCITSRQWHNHFVLDWTCNLWQCVKQLYDAAGICQAYPSTGRKGVWPNSWLHPVGPYLPFSLLILTSIWL